MEVIQYNDGNQLRLYLCQKYRKWSKAIAFDGGRIHVTKLLTAEVEKSGKYIDSVKPAVFAGKLSAFAKRYHVPMSSEAAAMISTAKMRLRG